jgi:hypothetical protein
MSFSPSLISPRESPPRSPSVEQGQEPEGDGDPQRDDEEGKPQELPERHSSPLASFARRIHRGMSGAVLLDQGEDGIGKDGSQTS